jgi:hypothetical protein
LLARGISGSPTVENVHGASVRNCAGPVTFQDCWLYGFWNGSPCQYTPGHGALVESSAAVVFERTTLEGTALYRGDASLGPDGNADGLRATSSSIALYSSTSQGGDGGLACLGYAGDGMDGGEGADFSACTVVAQDTSFSGGSGQSGWDGGNGGHGMVLRTGPSVVTSYGSTYAGGSGGQMNPKCWFCYDGYPGAPIANWSNSIVTTVPGFTRDFVAPAVTRENTQAALVSRGLGNDLVVLRISLTPGFTVEPPWNGVATTVASSTPERFRIVGTINGPTLAYSLPVGTVPASGARVLRLQSLHLAADGTRWLGDPRTLVVLDSIY